MHAIEQLTLKSEWRYLAIKISSLYWSNVLDELIGSKLNAVFWEAYLWYVSMKNIQKH